MAGVQLLLSRGDIHDIMENITSLNGMNRKCYVSDGHAHVWIGMKCVKVVELDAHELVSKKMNVVVSKILEAAGVVKTKGFCGSDILSAMLRGRGSLGRNLREVCAENKDCSHIFCCTGTLLP